MDSVDTDHVLYWNHPVLKLNGEHFCLQRTGKSNFEVRVKHKVRNGNWWKRWIRF